MSLSRGHSSRLVVVLAAFFTLLAAFAAPTPARGEGHVPIYDIQGAGHISPFVGDTVTTEGIVTVVGFDYYVVQDPWGDGDPATSDGMQVFKPGSKPDVGDCVRLTDRVDERIPGGPDTGNLSITQFAFPNIEIIEPCDWPMPEPVLIGRNGILPPNEIVISEDELPVNLQEDPGNFDPEEDAIDFYEAFEGMLVTVESPQAVGAARQFSPFSAEFWVLPSKGHKDVIEPDKARTKRGGIFLPPDRDNRGDQNPERIQIQLESGVFPGGVFPPPDVKVGDQLTSVTGWVGYSFGNFEVVAISDFSKRGHLRPERSSIKSYRDWVTVASYNLLNLSARDEDNAQREKLADQIVNALNSPDILAVQEIQDNNGANRENGLEDEDMDGVIAADQTLDRLVEAIAAAGGPHYEWAQVDPEEGSSGGIPGGNLRNAFLYNPDRVDLVDYWSLTPAALEMGGASDPFAFTGTRNPLLGIFEFGGNQFTVINNHLSSRFGSTPIFGGPQPFVQAGEIERAAQTQALNDYVDGLLAADPDAKVMVVGDFNTFEFTDELAEVLPGPEPVLHNLIPTKKDGFPAEYTFIFDGNSQNLDHFFVTDALLKHNRFDVVHVNVDFPRRRVDVTASDHEPLLAAFKMKRLRPAKTFTLQVLHASDLEGGVEALPRAGNFAAIIDKLEDRTDVDASLTLSAGDNYIPGPFFNASGDRSVFRDGGLFNEVYNDLYGLSAAGFDSLREGGGRTDITIMNIIGFDASAIGNHEFDGGSDAMESIIEEDFRGPFGPSGDRWVGAQFPYLSANIDFSGDPDLGNLFTDEILPNTAFTTGPKDSGNNETSVPKIAPATVINVGGGEKIGVIGATTPLLEIISSPSGDVKPDGNVNDMPALAAILQPTIDELEAMGINKIVLVSHLQQLSLEEELVTLLDGVDIAIAGGSDTLLANPDDPLRAGDVAEDSYPVITKDAAGDPVVIVSTDGQYSYVGQLTVTFDDRGRLRANHRTPLTSVSQLDLANNGPVKTEDADVAALWGSLGAAYAAGTKAELVQRLVDAVEGIVTTKDSVFVGETSVFLEGRRQFVRTEETNLGDLTADANLWMAQQYDPTVSISLKNGGGIRAEIGEIVNIGDTTIFLPPQDNPFVPGDDTGLVSQLDIENSLRFNNGLSLITLTAAELQQVIEHAVSASGPGETPGQFAQVGGMTFSFDVDLPAGNRVRSLVVGGTDTVVADGVLQGDPTRTFRMVTLNFLAGGGDGYPFPTLSAPNRVDLADLPDPLSGGAFDFAGAGSEQDALAEYMNVFHGVGAGMPYDQAETPVAGDTRIVQL